MTGTTTQSNSGVSSSDLSLIDKFKAKAAQFSQAYNSIQSYDASTIPADLQSQYNTLLSRGSTIKSTISWVTNAIDSVMNTFNSIGTSIGQDVYYALHGTEKVKQFLNGDSNLGFISLLPVAAIAAAIAAMGYYITDVYEFNKKIQLEKSLQSQGMSAQQAVNAASKLTNSPGILGNISNITKPLAIAAGLYFVWRIIKNAREGAKYL